MARSKTPAKTPATKSAAAKTPAKKKPPPAAAPAKRKPRATVGSVLAAVRRDLQEIASRDAALARGALAAAAESLARELDARDVPATAKASCARSLRDVMDRLFELAPAETEGDGLDALTAQREKRRGGR